MLKRVLSFTSAVLFGSKCALVQYLLGQWEYTIALNLDRINQLFENSQRRNPFYHYGHIKRSESIHFFLKGACLKSTLVTILGIIYECKELQEF